jgi:hypothetical protein
MELMELTVLMVLMVLTEQTVKMRYSNKEPKTVGGYNSIIKVGDKETRNNS